MRALILFIIKHHFVFLFFLFEAVALTLYINFNYYPQGVFYRYSTELSGRARKISSDFSTYFILNRINRDLADANARLLTATARNFRKIDRTTYIINDTVYRNQYTYVAAKVVSNSLNKRNNFLTLNKGKNDSLSADMAVISQHGIVGIVKNVSANFSTVLSVLNSRARISAKIKKNGYIGTLVWEGLDYGEGLLRDIPSHAKLNAGDTVITSGYSNIFPEGITIGTIRRLKKEKGESFYRIYVSFTSDFSRLDYVYVIKNIMKYEQDSLENLSKEE